VALEEQGTADGAAAVPRTEPTEAIILQELRFEETIVPLSAELSTGSFLLELPVGNSG